MSESVMSADVDEFDEDPDTAVLFVKFREGEGCVKVGCTRPDEMAEDHPAFSIVRMLSARLANDFDEAAGMSPEDLVEAKDEFGDGL